MYLYLNISLLNRNRDIFKYKRDRNLLKNHYLMMFPTHEPGMIGRKSSQDSMVDVSSISGTGSRLHLHLCLVWRAPLCTAQDLVLSRVLSPCQQTSGAFQDAWGFPIQVSRRVCLANTLNSSGLCLLSILHRYRPSLTY